MAADIATLELRVESGQVTKAGADLKQLGATGDAVSARLQQNFRASTVAVGDTAVAADRAGVSMGRFQNAIANLGLSAVGVQGPMQKVIETIAILGVGSVAVTAALAGIAALSLAFRKLSEDTRKAQEAYDKYMDSLRAPTPLAIIGAQLDAQRERLKALEISPNRGFPVIQRQIAQTRDEIARLETQYAQVYQGVTRHTETATEAVAAHTEAVGRQIARLHDMQDALAALTRTFDAWLAKQQQASGLFTISSVLGRTSGAGALPQADLAAMDRIANDLTDQTLRLVTPSEDIAEAWGDTARAALGAAQAIGGMSDQSLLLLHNAVATAEAFEKLAAAEKITASGVFGAAGALAGVIASISGLFGGADPQAEADRRALEGNTEALRRLTARIGDLGLDITGSRFTEMQTVLRDILALPEAQRSQSAIDARFSGTWGEFRDIARDIFGIDLNVNGWQAWLDALEQLDEAMRQTEITRFAETFSGALQAMEASFRVFNITDPVEQLRALGQVAGDFSDTITQLLIDWSSGRPVITGSVTIPGSGTGSPAFRDAMRGLDLGTSGGRNQLLTNLQALFQQLQAGTLAPSQLGGLTAQEFLDQLTSMIELIREAEEAAKANTDALRATAELLRNFSNSLVLGPLTTLSPVQQLVEARRQYDDVIEQAKAGDLAAAARVPALAQQLLEASRAVNASGPAYAAEFARVLFDSNVLAALFEDQADIGMQQLAAQQSTAASSAQAVTELQALVAQQAASSQVTSAQLAALHAEQVEMTRQVKLLAESALL